MHRRDKEPISDVIAEQDVFFEGGSDGSVKQNKENIDKTNKEEANNYSDHQVSTEEGTTNQPMQARD